VDVGVAHALEVVGGEGGAVAAAAVEDEFCRVVWNLGFDVAFDDAASHVVCAVGVGFVPFVVFADIYTAGGGVGGEALLGFFDGEFVDAGAGVGDELQESGRVFHGRFGSLSVAKFRGVSSVEVYLLLTFIFVV
jgi:hypothetical protein